MFTLFHLFQLTGAFTGVFLAAPFAYREWGWPAAAIAVPLGFVAGAVVGTLPYVAALALMWWGFTRSSNDRLKERLASEYYLSHLLIGELVSRGEPVEQFRAYVAGLLQSEDPDRRRFGYRNAAVWFPDLVADSPEARKNGERERVR